MELIRYYYHKTERLTKLTVELIVRLVCMGGYRAATDGSREWGRGVFCLILNTPLVYFGRPLILIFSSARSVFVCVCVLRVGSSFSLWGNRQNLINTSLRTVPICYHSKQHTLCHFSLFLFCIFDLFPTCLLLFLSCTLSFTPPIK